MKATLESHKWGCVSVEYVVRIEATPEELAELRAALKVVDAFKSKALHTAKTKDSPKAADWTMVGYAIKTDAVVVTIKQGACG